MKKILDFMAALLVVVVVLAWAAVAVVAAPALLKLCILYLMG